MPSPTFDHRLAVCCNDKDWMRLSAGRSTLAIITPVAARTGSSHSRFRGRIPARGTAFRPSPNCVVSLQVWCANPETLQGFLASCACAVTLMMTSRVQTSSFELIREVLLEIEQHDLQQFMNWTSLKPIVAIYDAVTKLDASPRLCGPGGPAHYVKPSTNHF